MTSLKKHFIFSSFLFAIFIVVGYEIAQLNSPWATQALEGLAEKFKSIMSDNSFVLFFNIFIHNALASLTVVLSFFLFGAGALVSLASNGVLLGIAINIFQKEIGLASVLALILPHGIFEIPAFLFCVAISTRLSYYFFKSFFPKNPFKAHFKKALSLYFKVVLPLLLLASFIESFITSQIARYLK